jgi:iron complex transport system permease protein
VNAAAGAAGAVSAAAGAAGANVAGAAEAGASTTEDPAAEAQRIFGGRVPFWVKFALVAALVLVVFVSFALGRFPLTPAEVIGGVWRHVFDPESVALQGAIPSAASQVDTVLFNIRLPRVLLVILVGAALSSAGAAFQGMFKNPLVSPDLLGASAGASLGACLAMLFNQPIIVVQAMAFGGGILAVSMAVGLNRLVRYDPVLGLVLGGILISTLFQSGMSLVKFAADANDKLPAITFWLMGSFHSADQTDLIIAVIPLLCGFTLLIFQSWNLNVLSFGDEEARSMGVNTQRTRVIVIAAATLLTSVSVAVAGIVGWVGLVIPHLARAIVGPNYRLLLPCSLFIGSSYLLIVDDIARLVSTVEIPIGILTAILGVPFFVFIFKHNMKGWR